MKKEEWLDAPDFTICLLPFEIVMIHSEQYDGLAQVADYVGKPGPIIGRFTTPEDFPLLDPDAWVTIEPWDEATRWDELTPNRPIMVQRRHIYHPKPEEIA